MNNLTIRSRIMASFAVVLALMVIMAAVAYTRLVHIQQEAGAIASVDVDGLTYANQILLDRIANYSQTQAFVLEPDRAVRQTLQTAIQAMSRT